MIPLRRQILLNCFKLFDLVVMVFSFALATWAYYSQIGPISFNHFLSMRVKIQNFVLFLCLLLLWHMIFSLFELHHSRRLSSQKKEVVDAIKATSVGTMAIFIVAFLFRIEMITTNFLAIFWLASTVITLLSRLMLRYTLAWLRVRGRNLRYMLIVGTNQRAIQFAKKLESERELGYRLVGFVDEEWPGINDFKGTRNNLVANLDELPVFLRDQVVDEVAIYLPLNSYYQQASRVIALCEEQGIIVRYVSDIFDSKLARSKTEQFGDYPMICHYTGAMWDWRLLVKRVLDVSLAMILLLFFSPLFLVTAIAIKATSRGPVFYIQERVGLNKRRFRLYKFRTMILDAESRRSEIEYLNEVSGPVFKIKDDPRITRIGKILRKTSIDELPQLLNVLKGEMSLVGPRPLPLRDYGGFRHDRYRRRFSIRPGMTCLWQINGRSSIPFERWMELDMEYIDKWSLGLDLKILVKTIPAVIRGSGAV